MKESFDKYIIAFSDIEMLIQIIMRSKGYQFKNKKKAQNYVINTYLILPFIGKACRRVLLSGSHRVSTESKVTASTDPSSEKSAPSAGRSR